MCKTKTQEVKFCPGGGVGEKDLRAPKDAHLESQALCIRKKMLRALFVFPKLSESKRGLNRQVLAAKSDLHPQCF